MQTYLDTVSGLRCRFLSQLPADAKPRLLVILNHGFGAPGDDLVDFGPWLAEFSDMIAQSCVFVFPAAPIDLGPLGMPGGRAWWPINMAKLAQMNETCSFDELTSLQPDGMLAASEQLTRCVKELQQRFSLDDASTVLGGFSQGAMVSTDIILRNAIAPALLIIFSGTLLCRDEWQKLAESHSGCRVLQSHGTDDPLLPFETSVQLNQILSDNGFTTEFLKFRGQHSIPLPVLERVGSCLEEILSSRT